MLERHPTQSRSDIPSYILLAGITLLALLLRLAGLGTWSFWIDEMFTVRDAHELLQHGFLPALLHMSPSTALIAATMAYAGSSEWSARLVPALIGVSSIPILYLPVAKQYGQRIGLTSALLLAIAPWHIYFSQNARYYTALMLFSMLACFLFCLGLEQKRAWPYLLLALICLVVAFQERLFALFFLPVALSYVLLFYLLPLGKPPGLHLKYLLPPVILVLLLVSTYLGLNLLSSPDPGQSLLGAFLSTFVGQPDWHPRWLLTGTIHQITVPVALLAIYGGLVQLRRQDRIGLCLILGATVPLISLMALAPFVRTTTHYALMILPCWIILAALGIWHLFAAVRAGRFWLPWIWAMLILIISLRDYTLADARHYLPDYWYYGILLAMGSFVPLVLLLRGWRYLRRTYQEKPDRSVRWRSALVLWATGIVLPVLLAALVSNALYYGYRHGDRADWKSLAGLFQNQHTPGDVIFSTLPPLANYYFGAAAQPLGDLQHRQPVNLDSILQMNGQTWVVEEAGVTMLLGDTFASWAATHCTLITERDHFISGRTWPLRLYRCSSIDN